MKFAFFDTKPYDMEHFDGKEVEFIFYETKLTKDTVQLARGCDGVCIFVNDKADKTVIDELYNMGVKIIALRCAGYNNVDVKYAFGKIHVVHVPAYSPYAVAEHAMAMLLTSVRKIHKAYNRTRDFNFSLIGLTGFDLYGKTVGVIGTGRIGKVFANICKGFGMKVLAYDKYPDENSDLEYTNLDEIFTQCDIISLHCPLTKETKHLISDEAIEKMKDGVIIINTSRGALIDAESLVEGLKSKKVGGACLDVYEEESDIFFEDFSSTIVQDDILARLISMPNVLVTSHQAFLTEQALANIADTTISNIIEFTDGGTCKNELCYKCHKVQICKKSKAEKCF